MKKQLLVTAVVTLGLGACGSDGGGAAATAKEGDAFCKQAQIAKVANDDLDDVDQNNPTEVKLVLGAAIDELDKTVKLAPTDIVDTAQTLLDKEFELEKLLKKYDYDIAKVAQSDEWTELQDDKAASDAGDDFDKYLDDKCGIATSDTAPSDTAPSDTTADTSSDTVPSATVPSDGSAGSTVDTIVDLGEGEAAINQFLDYYELGTGQDLTDEQRQCIVDALVDKVTGDELNQAISGNTSDKVTQALGLAFLNCNLVS